MFKIPVILDLLSLTTLLIKVNLSDSFITTLGGLFIRKFYSRFCQQQMFVSVVNPLNISMCV